MRGLYLGAVLLSLAGVLLLDRRSGLPAGRTVRAVLIAVPPFLLFDGIGAARGWFASNPSLNVVIVPPGIPLEEPLLLTFLALLSVTLVCGLRQVLP